jgi:hypothetical protein
MGDECQFAHGQADLREPANQNLDRGNPSRRGMSRGGLGGYQSSMRGGGPGRGGFQQQSQ